MDVDAGDEPSGAPWAGLAARAEVTRTPCGAGDMVWRGWAPEGGGADGAVPLVLLHGGAGSWLHWLRTIPAFADRRVLAADLPGLGDSGMPPEGTAEGIGRVVAAGLDGVLGEGAPCDLAGFSFGGVIAGAVAALRRPRTLTLVGAGGLGVIRRGGARLERVRDKQGEARAQAHRTNLHRWMIADPARIDDLAVAVQDSNSRRARFDSREVGTGAALTELLPRQGAPLAGIWGALDHSVEGEPGRAERVLRALDPACGFEVIADAGHWVMFEAPERFNAALRRRLEGAAR